MKIGTHGRHNKGIIHDRILNNVNTLERTLDDGETRNAKRIDREQSSKNKHPRVFWVVHTLLFFVFFIYRWEKNITNLVASMPEVLVHELAMLVNELHVSGPNYSAMRRMHGAHASWTQGTPWLAILLVERKEQLTY
jgi:hypothetical protein